MWFYHNYKTKLIASLMHVCRYYSPQPLFSAVSVPTGTLDKS